MKSLNDVLDKYEPAIRRAFMASIREITSQARIGQVTAALERGDVQGAIDALFIDRGAFDAFERAIADAYAAGGKAGIAELGTLKDLSGTAFIVRFDARNLRAEKWIREHSSDFITRITGEQRAVVRTHIEAGMKAGRNPKATALDITGRYNPKTKRREGGIIGLSAPDEIAVRNAMADLETGNYAQYLNRKARDKRFDSVVRRAMRDDKPLKGGFIGRAINRYSDGLLKRRGQTIARTETISSIHGGQYEALTQVAETGKIREKDIRRVWDSSGDARVRDTHSQADGQTVGLKEDFVMSSGARLRYPGDHRGGAAEVINCRCLVHTRIDYFSNIETPEKRKPKPIKAKVAKAPKKETSKKQGPQFKYQEFTPPKTASDASKFLVESGVAKDADLKGVYNKSVANAINAAQEVTERFSLKPLEFVGPASRYKKARLRTPKRANASVYRHGDGVLHLPTKFGRISDVEDQIKISGIYKPKYIREHSVKIDKAKHLFSPEAEKAAKKFQDTQKYGWSTSSTGELKTARKTTIYHEYGHVLHLIDSPIGEDINAFIQAERPRQHGWNLSLSEYAGANDREFIAESFAVYMSRPKSEYYRIHPALLKIFRKHDRAYGT